MSGAGAADIPTLRNFMMWDRSREGSEVARVRVPRKGVTQAELAGVLSRRLGNGFQILPDGSGEVVVRRTALSAAVVRITDAPGATVFRIRGAGFPVVAYGTVRVVTDALRRSPEFRGV